MIDYTLVLVSLEMVKEGGGMRGTKRRIFCKLVDNDVDQTDSQQ